MKNNSRRNFLKRSIFSLSSIAFVSNPIFSQDFFTPPKKGTNRKYTLKNKAKGYFYTGMYSSAEILYKELLEKYPNDISIYDGLGKVYSAQFKIIERVKLYKRGYERNLLNHLFYDRYAQSLRCLSLGFPNKEKEYSSQNNGIEGIHHALQIYLKAIDLFPDKKYLREHLLDVQSSLQKHVLRKTSNKSTSLSISKELTQQIQIFSMPVKERWEITRKSRKNKKIFGSIKDANISIDKINSKKRRPLMIKKDIVCRDINIKKETKSYLLPLFYENIRINKIKKAEEIYRRIIEIDSKENNCKGKLIKIYNKQRNIDQLINLYESQKTNQENFWSFVGLGKSYIKKGHITNTHSYFLKAHDEYEKCRKKINIRSYSLKAIISNGIAKSLLLTGNEAGCRNEILSTLSVIGTHTNGVILLCLYAESYTNDESKTEAILKAFTGQLETDKLGDDPIKFYIDSYINKLLLTERLKPHNKRSQSFDNKTSNESVLNATKPALYAMARLYKNQNNTSLYIKTLEQIALVDSKSPLIKERLKN